MIDEEILLEKAFLEVIWLRWEDCVKKISGAKLIILLEGISLKMIDCKIFYSSMVLNTELKTILLLITNKTCRIRPYTCQLDLNEK